jgi:hypothetical protein
MNIDTIAGSLGIFFGGILTIGAVAIMIWKAVSPFVKTGQRLKNLEECRTDTDEAIQLLLQGMLALMDNAVTGNSIEKIKAARDKMQSYLIARD